MNQSRFKIISTGLSTCKMIWLGQCTKHALRVCGWGVGCYYFLFSHAFTCFHEDLYLQAKYLLMFLYTYESSAVQDHTASDVD